jgi:hypothetical protein
VVTSKTAGCTILWGLGGVMNPPSIYKEEAMNVWIAFGSGMVIGAFLGVVLMQ